MSAIWSRIKELERVWIEIEARFDQFQGLPSQGGLQFYYAQLQRQYLVVHTNAKDAFNDAKTKEKAENKRATFNDDMKRSRPKKQLPGRWSR